MPNSAGAPVGPPPPPDPKLAILLRLHRRHEYLPSIFKQFRRLKHYGINITLIISIDRPTDEVRLEAENEACRLGEQCVLLTPDEPVLGRFIENFLPLQNKMLAHVPPGTDWVFVWDDDFLLDSDSESELRRLLLRPDVDAFFFNCLFIEDSLSTYNPAREHNSIRLYRHRPGARFSGKRMLSIPDDLHDEAVIQNRTAQHPGCLFEYGGFTEIDRLTTQTAYREAGKVDAFTAALTAPRSCLKPVPSHLISPLRLAPADRPRRRRSRNPAPPVDELTISEAVREVVRDRERGLFSCSAASADLSGGFQGLLNVLGSSRATCGPSEFGQAMRSFFDLAQQSRVTRPVVSVVTDEQQARRWAEIVPP